MPDWERTRRLTTAGIDWVVLSRNASTGFWCPYVNQAMKVCAVPRANHEHERDLEVSDAELGRTQGKTSTFAQPE
jgi:hypothetical protein